VGYRLVLVAVNERPEGLHAVEVASRIAAASSARLLIYHAVDVPSIPFPPDSPQFLEALRRLRERARQVLEVAEAIAASMGVKEVVRVKLEGDPVEGLWEVVRRYGRPDLIVVGRPRGRPGFLVGSRVFRILRGSPATVLVAGRRL